MNSLITSTKYATDNLILSTSSIMNAIFQSITRTDRWLWVLVASAISLPTFFPVHILPVATFYNEWLAAILWLIVTVGIGVRMMARDSLYLPPVMVCLVWFTASILLSYCVNYASSEPLQMRYVMTFMSLGLGALCLLAGANLINRSAQKPSPQSIIPSSRYSNIAEPSHMASSQLLKLLSWSGWLTALIMLIQLLNVENHLPKLISQLPATENMRPWANLNQPNHAANFLAIGLLATVLNFLTAPLQQKKTAGKLVQIFNTYFMILALTWSGSRLMWLYIGLITIIGWYQLQILSEKKSIRDNAYLCSLFAMLILFQYWSPIDQVRNWFSSQTAPLSMYQPASVLAVGLRESLWRQAWLIAQNNWAGVGFWQFAHAQWAILGQIPMLSEPADNAHNIVLDLMAKIGIPSTLLLIVLMGRQFLRTWHHRFSHPIPWLWTFGLGFIGIQLIHSFFEYPLNYLYFFLPFCFFWGLVQTGQSIPVSLNRLKPILPIFLTVLIITSIVTLNAIHADYQVFRTETSPEKALQKNHPNHFWRDRIEFWYYSTRELPSPTASSHDKIKTKQQLYQSLKYFPSDRAILKIAFLETLHGNTFLAQKMVNQLKWRVSNPSLSAGINSVKLACKQWIPSQNQAQIFCAQIDRASRSGSLTE